MQVSHHEQYGIQHAHDLAEDFIVAVTRYVEQLYALARELEAVQARVFENQHEGRVVLRLHHCGPTCLGCPHPVWKVCRIRRNTKVNSPRYGRFFVTEKTIKQPENCHHGRAPEVRAVIRSIRQAIRARRDLTRYGWRMRQHMAKKYPAEPEADDTLV